MPEENMAKLIGLVKIKKNIWEKPLHRSLSILTQNDARFLMATTKWAKMTESQWLTLTVEEERWIYNIAKLPWLLGSEWNPSDWLGCQMVIICSDEWQFYRINYKQSKDVLGWCEYRSVYSSLSILGTTEADVSVCSGGNICLSNTVSPIWWKDLKMFLLIYVD